MNRLKIASLALASLAALNATPEASAAFVTLPNSGAPLVTCNPKVGGVQSPTLTTCKVDGLPGSASLPGYILVASTTRSITVNSVVVGTLYDRVYCVGTGSTCDTSNTYIIATRASMSSTANFPARNANCPMWSSTTNECFEINNFFRQIRGSNPVYPAGSGTPTTAAVEVSTDIAYFMGTSSSSTNANDALAFKYLEYAGKTFKGLNQYTVPGNANYSNNPVSPGDRDATRVSFQADTNVSDPDGGSSKWSPWLFTRQVCPNGTPRYTEPNFAVKYWQGGEEGQIQQNVQAKGYACVN